MSFEITPVPAKILREVFPGLDRGRLQYYTECGLKPSLGGGSPGANFLFDAKDFVRIAILESLRGHNPRPEFRAAIIDRFDSLSQEAPIKYLIIHFEYVVVSSDKEPLETLAVDTVQDLIELCPTFIGVAGIGAPRCFISLNIEKITEEIRSYFISYHPECIVSVN